MHLTVSQRISSVQSSFLAHLRALEPQSTLLFFLFFCALYAPKASGLSNSVSPFAHSSGRTRDQKIRWVPIFKFETKSVHSEKTAYSPNFDGFFDRIFRHYPLLSQVRHNFTLELRPKSQKCRNFTVSDYSLRLLLFPTPFRGWLEDIFRRKTRTHPGYFTIELLSAASSSNSNSNQPASHFPGAMTFFSYKLHCFVSKLRSGCDPGECCRHDIARNGINYKNTLQSSAPRPRNCI